MSEHELQGAGYEPSPCALLPAELCQSYGLKQAFRGRQIFKWLASGADNFESMSDLPADLRRKLTELSPNGVYSSRVEAKFLAKDGTGKLKIRLADGAAVEAVLLSDAEERLTACLSTQVGCPMGCAFCKTATLGLQRNLSAGEIVEQFHFLSKIRGRLSNIVFMGMGEPLLNLTELRKAITLFTHEDGFKLSRRKITISTCGLTKGILDLADNGPHVRLAISLTSADDELRSRLMPVNRTHNLASLKSALLYYQEKTGDRITLEAAIMHGVNTGAEAAAKMAEWIQPLKVQVNIIPWNPVAGLPYEEPSRQEVLDFIARLEQLGINVIKRSRKGVAVAAACGQLGETTQD
ncbi:MAG: 23S rRNA (adenine(2503)-C(2))-methyltransferase RlmN [Spirochaetes bacterium]|nr:23S rRNA (adenine(2503)-C(2))-methyltransferase RlmN [Spirochaetota bacterium]